MKKLIILLFSSLLFSGELEVDGDLKVTGTIQASTIDSLKAVIADLQAQLAALQGESNAISSRIVQLPINIEPYCSNNIINLNTFIGEDQNWYRVTYMNLQLDDYQGEDTSTAYVYLGVGDEAGVNNGYGFPSVPMEFAFNDQDAMFRLEEDQSSVDLVMIIFHNNPEIELTCSAWNIEGGGTYHGTATLTLLLESNF